MNIKIIFKRAAVLKNIISITADLLPNKIYLKVLKIIGKNKYIKHKKPQPIRIALLIDEYFGGWNTAYGGYGFLARRLICKYLSNEEIKIEVILHGKSNRVSKKYQLQVIDGIRVYRLCNSDRSAKHWLLLKEYDLFLTIELTSIDIIHITPKNSKHILWIQDPRPMSEWDEINTVSIHKEFNYYDQKIYDYVSKNQKEITFISQGNFLDSPARKLYNLDENINIKYIPNPIEIPEWKPGDNEQKNNSIIFLGRLESVKRGWLFCEIARRVPEYQFYVLGSFKRESERSKEILGEYMHDNGESKIKNLHFVGHIDGDEKTLYLKRAKILVNTSIHEALPISFLEALSVGTLIVSCRNPEGLTEKFGVYTGPVLGDGFDKIDLFVYGIKHLINHEDIRQKKSIEAREYIKANHSINKFQKDIRYLIENIL